MTGSVAFADQIDLSLPANVILQELNRGAIPPQEDWSQMLEILPAAPAAAIALAGTIAAIGQADLDLIAGALTAAHDHDVYLVSNDEDLLRTARSLIRQLPPVWRCRPIDSLSYCNLMVQCGGMSKEIMTAALMCEYDNIHELPIGNAKRHLKLKRVRALARRFSLEVERAPQIPLDDAELREFLLHKWGNQDE